MLACQSSLTPGWLHLQHMVPVQEGLTLGAATTVEQTIALLRNTPSPNPEAWGLLADHLARIAGKHVRHAATLGGNLALLRSKGLQSDIATTFMAAGATVGIADKTGSVQWVPACTNACNCMLAATELHVG